MARVHPFQTNFTAGELTPKLAGQVDFKKYNNGGKFNCISTRRL